MGKSQIAARAFMFAQIILGLPHFSRWEQKRVVACQITTAEEIAITEFYSSINNMAMTSCLLLMPVDRELAYECLKWADPKVYKMYLNLRYRGMSPEQIEKDAESFYKLKTFILLNYKLDELEANGEIEIINDYDHEQILVKNNNYYPRRDENEFVV